MTIFISGLANLYILTSISVEMVYYLRFINVRYICTYRYVCDLHQLLFCHERHPSILPRLLSLFTFIMIHSIPLFSTFILLGFNHLACALPTTPDTPALGTVVPPVNVTTAANKTSSHVVRAEDLWEGRSHSSYPVLQSSAPAGTYRKWSPRYTDDGYMENDDHDSLWKEVHERRRLFASKTSFFLSRFLVHCLFPIAVAIWLITRDNFRDT